MNYIVMDLEFNRPNTPYRSEKNGVRLNDEIIEIGAVKLNSSLEQIDTYSTYVKPAAYQKMNKYVHKLTHITSDMLATGLSFEPMIENFLKWCGDDAVFVTWSGHDIIALEDNMLYHGLEISHLPECYDIQRMFADQIIMDGRDVALSYALWKLNISIVVEHFHDALCDALGTVEIFRKLDLSDGLTGYIA